MAGDREGALVRPQVIGDRVVDYFGQIGQGLLYERAQRYHGSLSVAGFYPSRHLNLADVHRRLSQHEKAREHLGRAQDAVGALGDDGYGRMIRKGIARATARLLEESGGRDSGVGG